MVYRIRVNRPPTSRFGSTSWDLLDSHGKPLELPTLEAAAEAAQEWVRAAVEIGRFPGERVTLEPYEV